MSSILDDIKNSLEELAKDETYPFSGGVYYGICTAHDLDEWNYFVFNRTTSQSSNDNRSTDIFQVNIVHEDYILEDFDKTVIKAMREIGLVKQGDTTYQYVQKGSTDIVVELATIPFKKARKVMAR